MTPDYARLERNICEGIKEGQIKLGFDHETVRLYYPLDSLENILGVEIANEQEMMRCLQGFREYSAPRLGDIEVSHRGERFCFGVSPKGTGYIHEHYETSAFLVALIEQVRKPMCKMEDILEVFHRFSDGIICEKGNHIDFDYVISFADISYDEYCYCFKFDEFHATYHRFTRYDFQALMAEE